MPEETKSVLANQKVLNDQISSLTNKRASAETRKIAMQEVLQKLEIFTEDDWAELAERAFIFGRLAPELARYRDVIANYVIKAKIPVIDSGYFPGIPNPNLTHVHIDRKVYALDAAHAKALDQMVVNDFNFSLKNAGVIKF